MGEATRRSGIPRNEVFLTTKIMSAGGSAEKTYQKCLDSVHKVDGEKGYVDLFLIHTPSGGPAARKEMYQALERLESEGKARSIGVSNFGVGHLEEMKNYARIWPPHVNQIEACTNLMPLSLPHVFPNRCLAILPPSLISKSSASELRFCKLSVSIISPYSSPRLSFTSTSNMQILTSMSLPASPMVPTKNNSRLLQPTQHHHRSILPPRAQPKSS